MSATDVQPGLDLIQQKIQELEKQKKKGKKEKKSGAPGESSSAEKNSAKLKKGFDELLADKTLPDLEKARRMLEEFVLEQINELSQLESELQKQQEKLVEAEVLNGRADADTGRAQWRKEALDKLVKQLQRDTEHLQEESREVAEQERQARQDLVQTFHTAIEDLKVRMEKQATERVQSVTENEDVRSKCRVLADEYEEREKQLATQQAQRDLEQGKLNETLKEKEVEYKRDAEAATLKARENAALEAACRELENQVTTSKGKLNGFRSSLQKSSKVMGQYQRERRRVEGHVHKLEDEKKTLIERHEHRMAYAEKEREVAIEMKAEAESRCKALQKERTELLQQIADLDGGTTPTAE